MRFLKSRTGKIISAVVAVALIAAAGVAAFKIYSSEKAKRESEEYAQMVKAAVESADDSVIYNGIYINGVDVGGMTKSKAIKKLRKIQDSLRPDINIRVKTPDGTVKLTEDDFEFTYNTRKIVRKAFNYGKSGSDEERYAVLTELEQAKKEYSITAKLVMSSINTVIKNIAADVDIAVVEPRITDFLPKGSEMFVISDGKNGRELDRDDLKKKLKKILKADEKKGTVKAVTNVVKFIDTTAGIKKRVVEKSSFSTVSTNVAAANENMRLALSSVNGTRLEPGETFSFNKTTGDTTNGSNGYKMAGAISNGKLIEEYGGGICQASTTVYGAVLRADLEIVERHNHTWPSVYVPIGQDASVDYPSSDFQFKNNKSYPIFIYANMSGTTLTVEIFGDKDANADYDEIKVVSEKTETIEQPADITQKDSSLKAGESKVEREGREGYRAKAYKVYYKNGVEIRRTEIASSYYPPLAKITRVGS